jgi:YggT family protein
LELLCPLLTLYLLAVFGRIILSWFPVTPGSFMASVFTFLYAITEPVLGPLRRVIPRIGMLDLSPLVVVFGIQIIQSSIGCGRLF